MNLNTHSGSRNELEDRRGSIAGLIFLSNRLSLQVEGIALFEAIATRSVSLSIDNIVFAPQFLSSSRRSFSGRVGQASLRQFGKRSSSICPSHVRNPGSGAFHESMPRLSFPPSPPSGPSSSRAARVCGFVGTSDPCP